MAKKRRGKKGSIWMIRRILLLIILLSLIAIVALLAFGCPTFKTNSNTPGDSPRLSLFGNGPTPTPSPTPTPVPTPTPSPTPWFYTPSPKPDTAPAAFGYQRELELDGKQVDSFESETDMSFGPGEEYAAIEGVTTFRGNNYRSAPTYGEADVSAKTLTNEWTVEIGSMPKGDSGSGSWTGSGWVGQPLIVRWPESTKQVMNLYDSAKSKKDLVEVIHATLDGNVYFLDLETGKPTRDKLRIGMPYKGAGSLDPRGYPILYLGSGEGYTGDSKRDARVVVYSLINFERLYEFGLKDGFALRKWHAYDSAPLVHAQSDTLLYPGENGVLYRVKLNTLYSESAGTLSMNPSPMLKYRYNADRIGLSSSEKFWPGYENSAAVWGHYLYLSDNAGLMQCIDLNTMDIVWVSDTWDDTNGSPVLEVVKEDHTAYLYIGTSLHWQAKADKTGEVAFFKIDAATGEHVWRDVRTVATVSDVSGGIQATAILGKHSISDLIIIPYARYPSSSPSRGALVALDRQTGAERWVFAENGYSWSSPIDIYDKAGNAYIVQADSKGNVYLLNGKTGELLDTLQFEENNFEASPAAFGNMIVLGSRAAKIYGIKIN